MAKVIGNLQVSNNITSEGNNVVRSVNNIKADINGKLTLDTSSIETTGSYGDVLMTNSNGTLISDTVVKYARLTTAEEFENEKNTIVSWNQIFNTWKRFSHGGNGLFPSTPSEINGWSYNSSTNQIYSTINSVSYIGMVSPERYDNYNLEVNLSSTASDDDFIGIVLAFVEVNGKEYTISAIRGCGGQTTTSYWSLIYNRGQADAVTLATNTTYPYTIGNSTVGWNGFPNGTNIKAVRTGNTITVSMTDFAAPNDYILPLTIDLTSLPVLAKFLNPCKVGYSALSQASATFKTLSFSGGNVILNIDTNQVWEYNFSTSQWDLNTSTTVLDQIKKGYIYVNQYSRQAYTLFDNNDIRIVAGHTVGNKSTSQIPSMKYFESVLSNTGYQKNPSGLCESWGTIVGITNSTPSTITLPTKFTEIYNIQVTVAYKPGQTDNITGFGSFNVVNNTVTISTSSSTSVDLYYRVIGKA